jgi:hypothetical protein
VGIYEISIEEKKCIPLLPGVEFLGVRFARDGKSFIFPVARGQEVSFYRQAWSQGKISGVPEVALKLPFAFSLAFQGSNSYDLSRDLSTIVYASSARQADLYFLSPAR